MKYLVILVLLAVCLVTVLEITGEPDPQQALADAHGSPIQAIAYFFYAAQNDDVDMLKKISKSDSGDIVDPFLSTLHRLEKDARMEAAGHHSMGMGAPGAYKVFVFDANEDSLGSFTVLLEEDDDGKWWVEQASLD
jgi:hypothetical protein